MFLIFQLVLQFLNTLTLLVYLIILIIQSFVQTVSLLGYYYGYIPGILLQFWNTMVTFLEYHGYIVQVTMLTLYRLCQIFVINKIYKIIFLFKLSTRGGICFSSIKPGKNFPCVWVTHLNESDSLSLTSVVDSQ